jgi:hypothetical protein
MKTFRMLAAICAVVLSAEAANALDFDFSFEGIGGTVTGEIDGLSDNTVNQPAPAVVIFKFPTSVGPVCLTPCNTTPSPWHVSVNLFTVIRGHISDVRFSSVTGGSPNASELDFLDISTADLAGPNNSVVSSVISFSPCRPKPVLRCVRFHGHTRCHRALIGCPL